MKKRLFAVALLLWVGSISGRTPEDVKMEKFGGHVVTQIGIVVRDVEKSAQAWAQLLGVEKPNVIITDPYDKAHTQYLGQPTEAQAKLAFFHLQNITIELIEPIGENSTWREVLEKQGEGVHHIAFQVKDMDENVVYLEKLGGKLVQKGDFTGGSYAYVDMMKQVGVVLELLTSTE